MLYTDPDCYGIFIPIYQDYLDFQTIMYPTDASTGVHAYNMAHKFSSFKRCSTPRKFY